MEVENKKIGVRRGCLSKLNLGAEMKEAVKEDVGTT